MKKFLFTLEAPKKLRKFKEYEQKVELGHLVREKKELENKIIIDLESLSGLYEKQEGSKITSLSLRFFSLNNEAIRKRIDNYKKEIEIIEVNIKRKIKDLVKAKNDVKIIDNIEKKQMTSFKKEYDRKINKELEDIYQNRFFREKKDEDISS
jgi:flagellar export protein FliJ